MKLSHNNFKQKLIFDSYKVTTIILIIFLMLCIISSWLLFFISGDFYLLIPFTCFSPSTTLWKPLFSDQQVCFHVILSAGLFCILDFTYKWDYMAFVFVWLISFTIMSSRSICLVTMARFHFLWLIFQPIGKIHTYTHTHTHTHIPSLRLKILNVERNDVFSLRNYVQNCIVLT